MFNKIIKTNEELEKLRIKFKNKKIGLCHGVFDIVHLGHIKHFEQAKKMSTFYLSVLQQINLSKRVLHSPITMKTREFYFYVQLIL